MPRQQAQPRAYNEHGPCPWRLCSQACVVTSVPRGDEREVTGAHWLLGTGCFAHSLWHLAVYSGVRLCFASFVVLWVSFFTFHFISKHRLCSQAEDQATLHLKAQTPKDCPMVVQCLREGSLPRSRREPSQT